MCVKIWINLFYSWIYFKLSMPLMMLHMQHTWFKSLLFPSVFVWKSLCIELHSISRVREWFYMKINKNKNDFTSIQLPVLIEFQRCPTPVWENDLMSYVFKNMQCHLISHLNQISFKPSDTFFGLFIISFAKWIQNFIFDLKRPINFVLQMKSPHFLYLVVIICHRACGLKIIYFELPCCRNQLVLD